MSGEPLTRAEVDSFRKTMTDHILLVDAGDAHDLLATIAARDADIERLRGLIKDALAGAPGTVHTRDRVNCSKCGRLSAATTLNPCMACRWEALRNA